MTRWLRGFERRVVVFVCGGGVGVEGCQRLDVRWHWGPGPGCWSRTRQVVMPGAEKLGNHPRRRRLHRRAELVDAWRICQTA